QTADIGAPQRACRWRPEQRSRRLLGGSARLSCPAEVLNLIVVDPIGSAVERRRSRGTEARGFVVPEWRDELEKWSLWTSESGWGRDPHAGTTAGRVAIKLRIISVISNARCENGVGCGLTNRNAIADCFRACGNASDGRIVHTFDRRSLRSELVEGDDVCCTDCRSFR